MNPNTSFRTFNYLVPSNGTTHVYLTSLSASASPATGNFASLQFDGVPFRPQGVWIDNTNGTGEAIVTIQPIGFSIKVPAGANMAANFPSTENLKYSVTGSGNVNLFWADFPLLPTSTVSTLDLTSTGGVLPVEIDSIAAGVIFDVNLPTSPTSPLYTRKTAGAITAYNGTVSGTETSDSIVVTNNVSFKKLRLSLSDNATLAAAGINTITVNVGGVNIFSEGVFVPGTALDTTGLLWEVDLDFTAGEINTLTDDVIITLSTALATGQLNYNFYIG